MLKKECLSKIAIHKCGICQKAFLSKSAFETHEKQHFQEKEYSCSYCLESMVLSELKEHISMCHMQLMFSCVTCNLDFDSTHDLEAHESRAHQGTKTLTNVKVVVQSSCTYQYKFFPDDLMVSYFIISLFRN